MKSCESCGSLHPDGVEICSCGQELSIKNVIDNAFVASKEPNTGLLTSQQTRSQVSFYAMGGPLFSIFIYNIFLTLITFGIYYFWGKVRVRKYLYNQTEFQGDRFAYHGTGKELLIGWSIAAVFLGIIFGLSIAAELIWKGIVTEILSTIFIYLGIIFLIPPAVVLSQKYRLSRTSWRGIRFSFRGEVKKFMRLYVPGVFLLIITLGLYYPYLHANVRKFQIENTYFGNTGFRFDGKGGDIFRPFVVALIFSVCTLGIYWAWFEAWRHNYYWSHTYFNEAKFSSNLTGGSLFLLKLVNVLLLVFTLGLAWPWVTIRTQRYFLERLDISGDMDLESITQQAQEISATGEGVSDILDIDIMGMNLGI